MLYTQIVYKYQHVNCTCMYGKKLVTTDHLLLHLCVRTWNYPHNIFHWSIYCIVHTYSPTTSHRCCYQFAAVLVVVALLSNHRTIELGGNVRYIAIGEMLCQISVTKVKNKTETDMLITDNWYRYKRDSLYRCAIDGWNKIESVVLYFAIFL